MKTTQKRYIIPIISIIAVVILLIIAGYLHQVKLAQNRVPEVADDSYKRISCFDSPNYFAIQRNIKDAVGSDILVKYKTSDRQTIPCKYNVGENDFEVKNQDAEYFMLFTSHYLLLDSGTGPEPRTFVAYDLTTQEKVFTDSYSNPITSENNILTYWNPTKTKATVLNCPDYATFISKEQTPIIEQRVTYDIETESKKELGQSQCVGKQ